MNSAKFFFGPSYQFFHDMEKDKIPLKFIIHIHTIYCTFKCTARKVSFAHAPFYLVFIQIHINKIPVRKGQGGGGSGGYEKL